MWKALDHPNILPLLGVTMVENQFVMVSEWAENGNINEYVKAKPDADRWNWYAFSMRHVTSTCH